MAQTKTTTCEFLVEYDNVEYKLEQTNGKITSMKTATPPIITIDIPYGKQMIAKFGSSYDTSITVEQSQSGGILYASGVECCYEITEEEGVVISRELVPSSGGLPLTPGTSITIQYVKHIRE